MPSVSESCSRIVECHRDRRITGRKHRDTTSFQVKTEDTSSTQVGQLQSLVNTQVDRSQSGLTRLGSVTSYA